MKELNLKNQTAIQLASKADKLVLDLVKSAHSTYRRELNHWKHARSARKSTTNPTAHYLQDVYEDAMLDTQLTAAIEHRILRVANKEFVIVDSKGITDQDKTQIIQKKWFIKTLREVMKSVFYGYTLLQFIKDEKGEIIDVKSIDRKHVIPEVGIVIKNISDTKGLDYSQFPNDLLFSSLHDDFGLLEKAVPMTILKRHSWASWDEFEQLFGMPIRIAKVASSNDKVKQEVANMLETMGSAAYGVFPTTADIEMKEANNRDAFNVFYKKINEVDSQLSILINGQTMTSKDGSSQSQANVHENTQNEITTSDIKHVLLWINDIFVPMLRRLGYKISEDERIDIERVTDPIEKMKTDEKIMANGYKLKTDYLERVYGVEIEGYEPNPAKPTEEKKQ